MAEVRKVNETGEKDDELENNTEAAVDDASTLDVHFPKVKLRYAEEPIFNVMSPVETFTGRTDELLKLLDKLQPKQHRVVGFQFVSISGLGGVGKSELARKYAWEYRQLYKHVIWINCDNIVDTLKSFKKLAEDLEILKPSPDDDENKSDLEELEKDLQSMLPKIYERLAKVKTLLIFDNVDKFEDMEYVFPPNLSSDKTPAIIITSRKCDWDEEGYVDVILLKQFTPDEATSYVKKLLLINDEDKSCDTLISELTEILCFFPLALDQAVSCIETKSSLSEGIQEYLNKFRDKEEHGNLLRWRAQHDRYTGTTYTTWLVTFENIRKKERNGDLAIFLVAVMSYLAPSPFDISLEIFTEIVRDEERLNEAIVILDKYSIITVENDECSILQLVQLVVRLWIKDQNREEEVLRTALTQAYNHITEAHAVAFWSHACNYTTLIDEYICRTYNETEDHEEFIKTLNNLVGVGNVYSIRKILDHLESKSDLWHKICSEMFHEEVLKCNHKDPTTEDTCDEMHVKSIYLFHAEVNRALLTSKTEELTEFLESFDMFLINSCFDGYTAVQKSVQSENLNVIKILFRNGADINFHNIHDNELLLNMALENNNPEVAEYLLDVGSDPNPYVDRCGRKSIHYAAKYGHLDIMKRLGDTKEDFENRSEELWTPLHFAAENDHLEIVKFLISKGVDVSAKTNRGQTACEIAVKNGSVRVVKYLIDNELVDVNLRNEENETLLYRAATHGRFDMVKYLISVESRAEEDINAFDGWGATPLFQAVFTGNTEIVRYLIQHGASVDDVQNETTLLGQLKFSALHLAAVNNWFEVAKILIEESDADINMGLGASVSPFQVANFVKSVHVCDLLKMKGADVSEEANFENTRRIFESFSKTSSANAIEYLDKIQSSVCDILRLDFLTQSNKISYSGTLRGRCNLINCFFNQLKGDLPLDQREPVPNQNEEEEEKRSVDG